MRIAIIGGGLAGICMAIQLRGAGFSNFTLYEKSDGLGGTWRENHYPGVACDVPSHLYSYSFEPNPNWSRLYSPGGEIQAHTEHVVHKHKLLEQTKFNKKLVQARREKDCWHLTFADGSVAEADYLVNAIGGLHVPSVPDLPGKDTFGGTAYHSAEWRDDHSLDGKHVAIIGTAASAVQIIPEIVDRVASLTVFQRTPNWVMPRMDRAYTEAEKRRFQKFDWMRKLHRLKIYALYEGRFPAFRGNALFQKLSKKRAREHAEAQVADPVLRAKLIPDYPVGCKRVLASDVYFPALMCEHVSLVTDPIAALEAGGVRDSTGVLHKADTLIYATGFKPFSLLEGMDIVGNNGLHMADYFAEHGIRAHNTVSVPGFPNFAMLVGPNSGLGHNSIILMIEAQVKYIIGCLQLLQKQRASLLDVRPQKTDDFDDTVQEGLKSTVWHADCKSWYKDEKGRNYTLWHDTTLAYRRRMRRVDPEDFVFG